MCSLFCGYDVFFSAVFFFFKQKTAYEMRISDWSSDVCSSDLRRVDGEHAERLAPGARSGDLHAGDVDPGVAELAPVHRDDPGPVLVGHQIGRASCRERVCQYV